MYLFEKRGNRMIFLFSRCYLQENRLRHSYSGFPHYRNNWAC